MASVCFYFQVHQPFRLRRYSVFDTSHDYFDDQKNAEIMRKVADKCYRPTTTKILDLVRRHEGRFRVAYSITGVALDQFRQWAPDVIDLFRQLAETGAVEFIAETYYHSLSFLYSRDEFREQVAMHGRLMEELFGFKPTTFRNTELIFNNDLAYFISTLGQYNAVLCEGVDRLLQYRSPNFLYRSPTNDTTRLLLKNYSLSDDIAFRFSDRGWKEWPLSAERFAQWVNQINGNGYVCNLFMDYETFGEHQWAETGIFDFLDALPEKIFDVNPGQNEFLTPSQVVQKYQPDGEYDVPYMISWADTERDLSAWLGNAMQTNALHEIYRLEGVVKETGDEGLIEDWRKLTTSDHFYYMCTKYFADGDVHKYFNPYESPYDSYINFMNVLDSVRGRAVGVAV
ncbi:MAG: glycoside hydrolase family 57 protein [Phycisphaerales bacterium]